MYPAGIMFAPPSNSGLWLSASLVDASPVAPSDPLDSPLAPLPPDAPTPEPLTVPPPLPPLSVPLPEPVDAPLPTLPLELDPDCTEAPPELPEPACGVWGFDVPQAQATQARTGKQMKMRLLDFMAFRPAPREVPLFRAKAVEICRVSYAKCRRTPWPFDV
jgi:hypothetical protein